MSVQNAYRTKLFKKTDVTIAADRMVRVEEVGIEVRFDSHMLRLRLVPRGRGLPSGAFPWELRAKR